MKEAEIARTYEGRVLLKFNTQGNLDERELRKCNTQYMHKKRV